MEKAWQRNITSLLNQELERLRTGNATQRSRFTQAMRAMATALQDPDLALYKKSDLAGHCAIDVGDQYRLFFFIEHDHHIVNFVWLNDENYIHTTRGHKDHCYEHFKKLIHDGEIKKYQHVETKVPVFSKSGDFKVDDYISFKCLLDPDEAHSGASTSRDIDESITMHLKKDEVVYVIHFIGSRSNTTQLKQILLKWMCEEADKAQVHYSYYLPSHQSDYEEVKKLLLDYGFDFVVSGKEEIYLRRSK